MVSNRASRFERTTDVLRLVNASSISELSPKALELLCSSTPPGIAEINEKVLSVMFDSVKLNEESKAVAESYIATRQPPFYAEEAPPAPAKPFDFSRKCLALLLFCFVAPSLTRSSGCSPHKQY